MSNDTPLKQCSKCQEWFPVTAEYWYRDPKKPDGFFAACKKCEAKRAREYNETHVIENQERQRNYRKNNADKIRESNRRYLKNNPHKLRQFQQTQRNKPTYHDDRSRDRALYSERIAEYRKWYYSEQKPDQGRIESQRRRARKRNLPVSFTDSDWERCLQYWDSRCCICGQAADFWHCLAQEHWIAISDPRPDNPGTVPWNILPMCHSRKGSNGMPGCNNSKYNKSPETWLVETLPTRKAKDISRKIKEYFEWVKQNSHS